MRFRGARRAPGAGAEAGPSTLQGLSLEEYHRSRSADHQPFRSACYAPFVGLTFDPRGVVSVCGFTRTTPLGTVGDTPLIDMWRGPVVEAIRDAVRHDDLRRYCQRCAEEIDGGNLHGVFARSFDEAVVDPEWPTRMEFSLSTACNLQCVMCSGEFSSAIRVHREGFPARRSAYGVEFVDELEPFLPHLAQARFLGGEPFLAEINHHIWDRMVELGSDAECNVTTNGTVHSPRIERLMSRLRFSVCVSVDGATPETVQAIRRGASHERILEHLGRFLDARERYGTYVSLSFCLMVPNWSEFADFLRWAEGLNCQVFVNTVRHPPALSLYRLPDRELAAVVDSLDSRRDEVAAELVLNRAVWLEQLDRLRHHLDQRQTAAAHTSVLPGPTPELEDVLERVVGAAGGAGGATDLREVLLAASVDGRLAEVECDAEECIVAASQEAVDLAGSPLVGMSSGDHFALLAERLGRQADILAERILPGLVCRIVQFAGSGATTWLAVVTVRSGDAGATTRYLCVVGGDRSATAVQLRSRPA